MHIKALYCSNRIFYVRGFLKLKNKKDSSPQGLRGPMFVRREIGVCARRLRVF